MISCVLYLAFTGVFSFLIGRMLPKKCFCADSFPYHAFVWEHGGRIYEKLNIKSWQKKVPDMSRLFSWLMPRKEISQKTLQMLPRMVQETCVAEFIHMLLCVSGLYCIHLWQGLGGLLIAGLNVVGNLAFVFIQRYNRPRLLHLLNMMERKRRPKEVAHACSNSQL